MSYWCSACKNPISGPMGKCPHCGVHLSGTSKIKGICPRCQAVMQMSSRCFKCGFLEEDTAKGALGCGLTFIVVALWGQLSIYGPHWDGALIVFDLFLALILAVNIGAVRDLNRFRTTGSFLPPKKNDNSGP